MLHHRVSATIGANSLVAESVDISGAQRVFLEVQTFANGIITATANIYCQVAFASTDTFRRVNQLGIYSAASGVSPWETPSGTGNFIAWCEPAAGFNFMKIESTKTATAALTCYVHTIHAMS